MQSYRQGDVFLRRVRRLPDKVAPEPRENGRLILARGEVTGHSHAIAERGEIVIDEATNRRFLRLMEEAFLCHEEHGIITIAPGLYEIIPQREWSDEDEPRRVMD